MGQKKALVTGGTRGIGAAIALELESLGHEVIVTGTKDIEHLAGATAYLKVDFSDLEETRRFIEEVSKMPIDILVNNAGINKTGLSGEIEMEDWDRIQRVNLRGPMALSRALVSGMGTRGYGRIVNITSIFGHVSKAGRVSYSTSKFGLLGITKAMALDYAKENVLINGLAPGFIDTELTRKILSVEQIEELVAHVPMGRLGKPEEIAKMVAFLTSEDNTFMTGQNIIVDGGFTCA